MPERLSSAECKDSHEMVRTTRKDKPALVLSLEFWLQSLLAWFLQLLLHTFFDLQDAFLAIGFVRRLVAFALAPRCQVAVLAHLKSPAKNKTGFQELQYHVAKDARELLVHASLHALITSAAASTRQLPAIGRILLQTGTENSGKFQEAVAGALAHELRASLLIVDEALLAEVSVDALGESLDSPDEAGLSIWAYLLSFWLSGGKVAFVWDMLHRICTSVDQPLVVLIRDVETTVCSGFDSYEAFVDAFGSLHKAGTPTEQPSSARRRAQNMVLLGGTSLGEKGTDLAIPGARALLDRQGQDARRPGTPAGADDAFSLLPELSLVIQEERPNPRKLLDKLFLTRVRLDSPASGAAAEQHRRQLAQDAADLTAERNLQELTSFGIAKSSLPPLTSAVIRHRQLSREEWSKVVTWAKSMEAIIRTREVLDYADSLRRGNQDAVAALLESATSPTNTVEGIRRSASSSSSRGMPLEEIAATLKQLKKARKDAKTSPKKAASKGTSGAVQASGGGVALSERALWYGMRMLERGGSGMRPAVKPDNMYERRLLQEVVRPEDSGAGFADVGALNDVKDALREVVQLPLQHPELFASGSLARLTKGVLLFGPPGTGKTMLARAVAAECGASFLAIHPSAVASKWLGDGVRYVRAVFSLAAKLAPCVIFFDEVDALLSRRNSHNEHESLREMKNEAMAQWDGIRPTGLSTSDRVVVLGATNRPQDLDEAVLRRFSRRIFCDVPNRKARQAILEVILAGERLADDVDLGRVADRTEGFSGSDLRQVCTAAAMIPLRELLRATGKSAAAEKKVKRNQPKQAVSSSPCTSQPASEAPTTSSATEATANGHISTSEVTSATVDSSVGGETVSDPSSSQNNSEVEPQANENQPPAEASSIAANGEASASRGSDAAVDAASPAGQENGDLQALKSRMEMMGVLLEECDRMADSADGLSSSQLRPITMADFEEASRQVSPSLDEDSHTMDELRTWNSTYGEGNSKYHNPKLTYFI